MAIASSYDALLARDHQLWAASVSADRIRARIEARQEELKDHLARRDAEPEGAYRDHLSRLANEIRRQVDDLDEDLELHKECIATRERELSALEVSQIAAE